MSVYIKLSTSKYPLYEGDIRLEHPEITEDQTGETFICPDTYALVQYTERPTFDPETHITYQIQPTNIDGVWREVWETRLLTEEEINFRKEHFKPIGVKKEDLEKPGSAPDVVG